MATSALGQRRAARGRTLRRLGLGLFFISPWIAHFLLLNLYPMAASFYYSLTDFPVLRPPRGGSQSGRMGADNLRGDLDNRICSDCGRRRFAVR